MIAMAKKRRAVRRTKIELPRGRRRGRSGGKWRFAALIAIAAAMLAAMWWRLF